MEPGSIVEFIDRQKIMCAVVLDIKNLRLRLLTENNREVNLSANRLSHRGNSRLDLSMGRDRLVDALKKTANRRRELIEDIDIRELWEVLNTEQQWIDFGTMTQFCFPDNPTYDHEAAVIRALFNDRQYFKFNPERVFPNTREQVERIKTQAEEELQRARVIEAGSTWLKGVLAGKIRTVSDSHAALVEIFRSYFLFEKESPHHEIVRDILEKAGYKSAEIIFKALCQLDVWDENENLALLRYKVPREFPKEVIDAAAKTVGSTPSIFIDSQRKDLRSLSLMTIDGQATLDFDDALSIQKSEDHYLLGVHIADVGLYVKKGDPIDREAMVRASSIYMPDGKISMIPPDLSENLCSLKAGQDRPAISILIRIRPDADIIGFEIVPSVVRVSHQMTYYDVNLIASENEAIGILYEIGKKFQQRRLENEGVQITLPEINVWIDAEGNISLHKTNRESPGRLLVAELMIMANWLMARHLASRKMPAIFRSQSDPRERLYRGNEGSLFQNWMQRKHLSRFVLSPEPEPHSGLGLDLYLTASSPIRKYFDLATQRQIRATFGLESPYSREEILRIIQDLEEPMSTVGRIQYERQRYWLLKYIEGRIGHKEEAIVLMRRKGGYQVLLTDYMIEAFLPVSAGMEKKPEENVQVTVQHADARRDILTVSLG
jgi:exoribonuclease-2